MSLFFTARLVPWVLANLHIIAAVIGVGFGAWWLVDYGIDKERAKWEAAQAEQMAALQTALAETREDARRLDEQVQAATAARDALLERLNDEALNDVGAANLCFDADGVRGIKDALETIRSGETAPGS